jgi:hypothetical protein
VYPADLFLSVHKLVSSSLLSQNNNYWSDVNFVLGLLYRGDVGHVAEVAEAGVGSILCGWTHPHRVTAQERN